MFENDGDAIHEHDLLVTKRPEKQIPSPPGWEEQQKAIAYIGIRKMHACCCQVWFSLPSTARDFRSCVCLRTFCVRVLVWKEKGSKCLVLLPCNVEMPSFFCVEAVHLKCLCLYAFNRTSSETLGKSDYRPATRGHSRLHIISLSR